VITAKDVSGLKADQKVEVTIVNGAPVITAATTTANVSGPEDVVAITGAVKATDPESGAIGYSIKTQGTVGAATIDATTGAFSYKPNADANTFTKGLNSPDTFVVSASDLSGQVTDQTVSVTVNPVNDAPRAGPLATTEFAVKAGATAKVDVDAIDIDSPVADLKATVATGPQHGTLTFGDPSGNFYTPRAGFIGNDKFVVSLSDGKANSSYSVAVKVEANPVNTVSLDDDSDGSIITPEQISLTTGVFKLTDSPTVANVVKITGLTSDDFFSFGGLATDYKYSNSSNTLEVSANIAGAVSSISIVGVTIGSFVSDEASAETGLAAALGVTGAADFFRFSGSTGGGGENLDPLTSLDYDTDSSIATVRLLDADSTVSAIAYTDSSKIGSNASIANFGKGAADTITVDTVTSSWNFSSGNSQTGSGLDIDISYNNNGGSISSIKLIGVAPVNAATAGFVTSEQTAEASLGYDFFRSAYSKTSEPQKSNVALDLPSGDFSLRTLDAGSAGNQYLDDALVPDQVRITNFGLGDSIVITNAGTNKTFFGTAESSPNDIEFSMNVNGKVSSITLVGAVTAPGFVYDEATAEKAVGFDFFNFA